MTERRLRLLLSLLHQFIDEKNELNEKTTELTTASAAVAHALAYAQKPLLDNAYAGVTGKLYTRDLLLVEVLSDAGTEDMGLYSIADLINDEEASGFFEIIESDSVDANFMAGLLADQASDPSLLLGEPPASQKAPETPEGGSMPEGA